MLLAQLTDFHMRTEGTKTSGLHDTNTMSRMAIDRLLSLDPLPDAVILTGDLTDRGMSEEYAILRTELAMLPMPVHVIPGNHDVRKNLAAGLAGVAHFEEADGFIQYAVDLGPAVMLALDTVVPGEGGGNLCAARLGWIESKLHALRDRDVLIAMHHPPAPTGIGHMDRITCRNGEALAALVRRHGRVRRVICGHVHRPIHINWAGTVINIAPGVAHQVAYDIRKDSPGAFTNEPPAMVLHHWMGEDGPVSHTVYVNDFPGPFRIRRDPDYPGMKKAD